MKGKVYESVCEKGRPMEQIYITGHRNPDLDSICSASAYAVLKNHLDPKHQYVAVRCGHLSSNVKGILTALNLPTLPYMQNVYPKVGDVVLQSTHHILDTSKLSEVARFYDSHTPSVIPVYQGDKFYGLLSVDDITSWVMKAMSGKDSIDYIPMVKEIMREEEEPVFATELFEDAKQKLSVSQKRGLAVYNEEGFFGYVTRRCFLKAPKYNVILVDHNEPRQSIKGIEEANIVEIIDHHRIDAVKTDVPIYIDAEPLGSTCTIVYQLFLRHNVTPDEMTAKTLLTGILSDTVILKSPTTTYIDQVSAKALAAVCKVNLEEFGLFMFSNTQGLKTREPQEAIASDFKTYSEKGVTLGIGQCEVTTLHDLSEYAREYLENLEQIRARNGLDWAVLMITDILKEHSVLLCTEHRLNGHLQYHLMENQIYDMPNVLSRKKQLLPELLNVIDMSL